MRKIILLLISLFTLAQVQAKDFKLTSPDGRIKAVVSIGDVITYSISFNGDQILLPSAISITMADGSVLGKKSVLVKDQTRSVDQQQQPLYGITATIRENYNELSLWFKTGYSVVFRAYNEGFAYRFVTSLNQDVLVKSEQSDFRLAANDTAYFHPILSEALYRKQTVSDFKQKPNYTSLPLLVKGPKGLNILIHEADVLNYPCLTLAVDSLNANTLIGHHAPYPKVAAPGGYHNFNMPVTQAEPYIAKTTGTRSYPWRMIALEAQDKDILKNQLVYLLASPNVLEDVSWIKPGKVSWDWWNALNLTGVKFKTGFNTDTYKYFIDFAAKNNIPYINLDEGWSDQFNLLKVTDQLNMNELMRYAKEKHVGIILWCVWHTLDKQMDAALAEFGKWGIAGLKVDFMDRDDQVVVEFHQRLLKEAAKRNLLVNFHGAYHPTGLQRTYPNNINVEGVHGLEWDKFDKGGTPPGHDVSIPFIRMFAGSMDYTPGAMQNYNETDWKQIFDRPMSQGTRAHQLAMYVVYFAPLQMLSDAPTAYEREPEILNFLSTVPTTWDDIVPVDGKVGDYVAVARRKNTDWYLGAMTDWNPRQLDVSLDFLQEGKTYQAEIYADGPNAGRVGNDYTLTKKIVKKGDKLQLQLAAGGGWVAWFKQVN